MSAPTERNQPVPDLIRRCARGEAAAQAEFIGEYGGFLRAVIARSLGAGGNGYAVRSELEDLHAELLAKLLDRERGMLDSVRDAGRIHGWLSAVAHTHVIDHFRRDTSRKRALRNLCREERERYHPPPDEAAMAEERRAEIRRHLARLTPRQRIAIELYYMHEMSYSEISEIMGTSINTVASHIRRGKKHLRELLGERA